MVSNIEASCFEQSKDNFHAWVKKNFSGKNAQNILTAWIFVIKQEPFSKRRDGTLVLSHAEAVAKYLYKWGFDSSYVVAALLHDMVEDAPNVDLALIRKHFGKRVEDMVDFMSKNVLDYDLDYFHKVERFLKLKPNYVFLRLADQFHNVLNYQGYRNYDSLLENCNDILFYLQRAQEIIALNVKLQNNKILINDLAILKFLARSHL